MNNTVWNQVKLQNHEHTKALEALKQNKVQKNFQILHTIFILAGLYQRFSMYCLKYFVRNEEIV